MTTKYDKIGMNYDTSRKADPYLLSVLARLLPVSNDKSYLDIACGSGNYTTALAAIGGSWSGIDQSEVMLGKARRKPGSCNWLKGEVTILPFETDSFDGVTCTLAIHHFDSLTEAFMEVRRVLKPGCRFVLFTSTSELMKGYWLTEYFPVAMKRSRDQMPALDDINQSIRSAGFASTEIEAYSIKDDLQDFFLYSGKFRPKMYLDPTVRSGISTFSSLADAKEIEEGCRRLERDIESGQIKEVISGYENDLGDYCFLVSE